MKNFFNPKTRRYIVQLVLLIMILFSVLLVYLNYNSNENEESKKQITATAEPQPAVEPTVSETPSPTPEPTPRIKKVVKYKRGELIAQHTIFHSSSYNRDTNLRLYCETINSNWKKNKGYWLKPGETFEWYDAIGGPPTKEKGYMDAPVIINHQSVPGIGGGACEVASTINTTVLKIKGITTHAIAHSENPGYFRKGIDFEASVAYGNKTFSFENTKKYGMLIKMRAAGGVVTCKVFKMKKIIKYVEYWAGKEIPEKGPNGPFFLYIYFNKKELTNTNNCFIIYTKIVYIGSVIYEKRNYKNANKS